ncbi:MAG: glycoside hydrolase family 38, partial [Planctomycetes bacterium]|nr:glycoside hydrolase family 38 [Planctomycetota bacterium]
MSRTAHYVASTHWDREWYESFQGYRMRLVSLLDEVLATMASDPAFRVFTMDGQVIPIVDYLEIRPERRAEIERLTRVGRLKLGPWYVMPDEWLVSGESLVRNLQLGVAEAERFGGASRAGFVCDMFGHIAQLPQLFAQMGGTSAFIWRGVHEKDHGGNLRWRGLDGSALDTYRFGQHGYCTYAFKVRLAHQLDTPFVVDDAAVERLTAFVLAEAKRCPHGPILLFDGADHVEIEPRTSALFARANTALAAHGIRIEHSDLDRYAAELAKVRPALTRVVTGELRETGRESLASDEHWLIPGTMSSRIHLKQRNAACEDELTLWAEPFSAFARALGGEWPASYLATAWRWLLENHPHDSMCGCSIDQVHQDMLYRFDQSFGIASRLTAQALRRIALAAAPRDRPDGALTLTVFNPTADDLDEPIDLDVPLPTTWPKRFQEFFGFEEKFAFRLRGPDGADIPYQLVGQSRDRVGIKRPRYKFPNPENRHVVHVTARVRVPAFGWAALVVAPVDGPIRYSGTLAVDHRTLDNGILRVAVNQNGTLDVLDHRTGIAYRQLLTFEQRADIGDGWFHGLAVNDQIFTSAAGSADVAVIADGIGKATLRIHLVMRVPARFDGKEGRRSAELAPLTITSDVTLRAGADRVEVTATVDNNVRDHRLRVLLPTGLSGDRFVTDSAFAVVERAVDLPADNDARRELDVETRPQFTWT